MSAELAQTGWLQQDAEASQAFNQQVVEPATRWSPDVGLLAKFGVVIGFMIPAGGALSAATAEAKPGAKIVVGQGIDGVNIGATPSQVKKDLGKPIRSSHAQGETIFNYASPLYMTTVFSRGHLNGLLTSSKQFKTSKGIGIGSSPEAVKSAYPQADCTPGAGPGGPQSLACIIKSKHGSGTVETAFEFTIPAAGVEEIDIDKV
jgi:hypothetical protein